jgi:hypothetical protein
VAESKKSETKAEPKVELADGSASHDPVVHQLMAHRYTATQNGDDEAYALYTAQLNELGYK